MLTWLLMMRPFFFLPGSQKVYTNLDRLIGQHIGYRPKFPYWCIPILNAFKKNKMTIIST